jgi:hypothetical protein
MPSYCLDVHKNLSQSIPESKTREGPGTKGTFSDKEEIMSSESSGKMNSHFDSENREIMIKENKSKFYFSLYHVEFFWPRSAVLQLNSY